MTVCSWITIPLPFTPIPINLGTFATFMAGGLLGKRYGAYSIISYVLLGAIGLPVFAGFGAGLGTLAGPTGGFIIGFILCAFISGFAATRPPRAFRILLCLTLGLIACYACGIVWFMISTGASLKASLLSCVVTFLFGDALKILLAFILLKKNVFSVII